MAIDKTTRDAVPDRAMQDRPTADDRLRREPDAAHADRAMQDRSHTENRVLNDDERLDVFRTSFTQAALPDLPRLDGWHVCWLSTTNPKDPIHFRLRIGYELIRSTDVPGYETMRVQDGQAFAGHIMVGEMIAARLPMSLYQKYMREAHHDAPREEEERLRSALDTIREHATSVGSQLLEGDGLRELASPRAAPFSNPKIRMPDDEAPFQ